MHTSLKVCRKEEGLLATFGMERAWYDKSLYIADYLFFTAASLDLAECLHAHTPTSFTNTM